MVTRFRANRIGLLVPFVCSAIALAIVLANIVAGVPPQPDENASAHIFQMLMVAQLPFIVLFVASADWGGASPAKVLALQILAMAAALLPVWIAGY
jgi:hypothetical protein